jgi:hypothetical protein
MLKRFSEEHIAVERPHINIDGATQRIYRFPNNYGASVIWGVDMTMLRADSDKPYEVAIIRFVDEGDHYYLDYSTPLADDVFGYQNEEQVRDLLKQIKDLERVEHGII